jgi:transcriptional regulator with XRE-family HTH domain
LNPAEAGFEATPGGRRRVPGLRREEVAMLAGVSTDYYARMEKGNLSGVSEAVLHAVARALRMDEAEREHFWDLARAAGPLSTRAPRRRPAQVRSSIVDVIDSMAGAAAFVRNGRLDVLAINPLGRALYSPMYQRDTLPTRPVNLARFNFLEGASRDFYDDWESAADTTVALLRTEAGRDPLDKELTDLVGELATRSEEFRVRWAAHDVRLHREGTKHFVHPVVGLIDLEFNAFQLPAEQGLTMTVYTAPRNTSSHDALMLLASWSATGVTQPTDG